MLKNVFLVGLITAAASLAAPVAYYAALSGANESPSNASTGAGLARVIIDPVAHTMEVIVSFSGLTGNTTASHIHCCTAVANTGNAGVATVTPNFTGFPLGVTSGSYDRVFDTTLSGSYNAAFVTAQGSVASAEAALFAGIASGNSYLNIHSSTFAGGEIRGFLIPVPEPTTVSLLGAALLGLGLVVRKRVA